MHCLGFRHPGAGRDPSNISNINFPGHRLSPVRRLARLLRLPVPGVSGRGPGVFWVEDLGKLGKRTFHRPGM